MIHHDQIETLDQITDILNSEQFSNMPSLSQTCLDKANEFISTAIKLAVDDDKEVVKQERERERREDQSNRTAKWS